MKTSKLHVTGPCAGNSPVTGEFPVQMASNAENVSIWWRHHDDHYDSPVSGDGVVGIWGGYVDYPDKGLVMRIFDAFLLTNILLDKQ